MIRKEFDASHIFGDVLEACRQNKLFQALIPPSMARIRLISWIEQVKRKFAGCVSKILQTGSAMCRIIVKNSVLWTVSWIYSQQDNSGFCGIAQIRFRQQFRMDVMDRLRGEVEFIDLLDVARKYKRIFGRQLKPG